MISDIFVKPSLRREWGTIAWEVANQNAVTLVKLLLSVSKSFVYSSELPSVKWMISVFYIRKHDFVPRNDSEHEQHSSAQSKYIEAKQRGGTNLDGAG